MLFNAQPGRFGVPMFVSALIITGLFLLFRPATPGSLYVFEEPLVSSRPESTADSKLIVERGVKALRGRVPRQFIRGMLDRDFELVDFRRAALKLAPEGNANAEFILGWLCEDGIGNRLKHPVRTWLAKETDLRDFGLTSDENIAAEWYILSSVHGCADSSRAMGNMLENSYGGRDESQKHFALAVRFYERGMAQGDDESRIHFAMCYAYGRGVIADGKRAWYELLSVMRDGDEDNSTYAIVRAIQGWKDGRITPPQSFSRGATTVVEFLRRYDPDMTQALLDELYTDPGCTPNPNPQFRRDLATKVRKEWLAAAKSEIEP